MLGADHGADLRRCHRTAQGRLGKCPTQFEAPAGRSTSTTASRPMHGKMKLFILPVCGFKTMNTAFATIKGFEVKRTLRKCQAGMFALQARQCRRGSDRRARIMASDRA